ncbi:MAG: hypothetical protein V5A61_09300 [Haloarculaceae archaeon]|jgi:hypothetical protein
MPTPVVPPVPAHAVAAPLELRLAVAAVAGLLATLVMTGAMSLLSEGYVPPYVAASALFGEAPGRVTRRQADAAHYGAGLLAGLLFETLVVVVEAVRDATVATAVVVGNVLTFSDFLAALLVVAFLYVFFSYVVFPRYGERLYDDGDRRDRVRFHWMVSANVYGLALLAGVVLLYAALGLSAL